MTEQKTAGSSEPVVAVWTDGACEPNPGFGGYGAVLEYCGERREIWGPQDNVDSFRHQTNNRMEMIAVIEALTVLRRPCRVRIMTDSQYVIGGMTLGWSRRTNVDLWHRLDDLVEQHKVEWIKVRAHTGKNQRAHELASKGIRAVA